MLKDRICKYCGKLFENIEGKVFSNHVRWCDKNPKDRTKEFEIKNKKLKQNIINKEGEIKLFKVTCYKCGKEFQIEEREKFFPKKDKYFCSRKCANSRVLTKDVKEKISKSLIKNIRYCQYCGNIITEKTKHKYCSLECLKNSKIKRLEETLNKKVSDLEKEKFLYRIYKNACSFKFKLSDYPDKFDFELIKKYGWYKAKNHGNNLNGISRDHMYSIRDGYLNKIDPKIISHPANCCLVRHNENQKKGKKSSITLDELLEKIKNW